MSLAIELTPDIEQRLDRLARETGRSRASLAKDIIAQGLEDIEDYYIAQKVLSDVEAGHEKLHKSQDVRRALGLDD